MLQIFFPLILSLNDSFLLELKGKGQADFPPGAASEGAAFTLAAARRMQAWIRFALVLLLFHFELSSMFRFRKRFPRLSQKERVLLLQEWRDSRLGYRRKFVSLMHNLFLLSASNLLVGEAQYPEYEHVQRFYQGK